MALNLKRKREKNALICQGKKRQIVTETNTAQEVGTSASEDGISNRGSGEEEGWKGFTGEEHSENQDDVPTSAVQAEPHTGKKGKKPPTGKELRAIKDAADLFRSNSFKLQIDELLPNVRPKSSRMPPLDRFLLSLHTFLTSLPPVASQHPLEGARSLLKKGIAVPYSLPLPTEDAKWKVSFEKPTDVTLVGSWVNKTSVKCKDGGHFGVDLAVEMPQSLFQEKDYLNGRFFHKRAFYLASIAAAIQRKKSGLDVDILYESRSNNPRFTTLILRPRKDDSSYDFTKLHAQIRIIPVLPSPSPIPLHRLSPAHSNIRISSSPSSETQTQVPTPLYNTSLLLSVTPKPDLLTVHTWKQSAPAFVDALTLLRVWANQRGYGEGKRLCVRGFEGKGGWWAAVVGLLLNGEEGGGGKSGKLRRPVGKGLSSYQIFRAALDFLAKHNFAQEPVFLKTNGGHQFSPEEYTIHHEAIFVDAGSMVNLLAGVPLSSLDLLQHDAKKTLELLDDKFGGIARDHFHQVFLKEQRDLPSRFDTIICVDLSSAKPRTPDLHSTLDHGSEANALLVQLAATLRRGLGDRAKVVAILHPSSESRSISQAHPLNPSAILIGLIHDSEHASRLVDHGPAADDPDPSHAEQFRDFWGDKAELRRFKDGRIVESVVWDVRTSDEKAHIPSIIVRYLLARHFGLAEVAVQSWEAAFDSTLRLPENVAALYHTSAGVSSGFKGAMTAFDQLVKILKALDGELPLSLVNVSPISEYLRYTSVFSPVALSTRLATSIPQCWRYFPAMEIILEFEKSGRWPDDLCAIQKIKIALFERVANALVNSKENIRATVVVNDDAEHSDIRDQSRLEIITAEGWAFSARIWHDREGTLLNRIIDDKPRFSITSRNLESKGKQRQEALDAWESYTRRFIHAPRHHRAVTSLCHRFVAYAGTVRLVKRWLASHWLLHGHVSEEAVEIICAAFFVGDGRIPGREIAPEEWAGVPGTKERGFAAVVDFLKDWTWEEPLHVPLYGAGQNNGSSKETTLVAGANLGAWRVLTKEDRTGYVWTSTGPNMVAAHRVRAIAKATWDYLSRVETGSLDVKGLFIHPTEDYDFIIQLEPSILPRYFQNISVDPAAWSQKSGYVNMERQADDLALRPGFDPTQLLFQDVERLYKGTMQLFYDPIGGDRIGAVWDPSVKQQRPFRVLGGFSGVPGSKDIDKTKSKKDMMSLNKQGVLSEIERLASGFTKSIIIQI